METICYHYHTMKKIRGGSFFSICCLPLLLLSHLFFPSLHAFTPPATGPKNPSRTATSKNARIKNNFSRRSTIISPLNGATSSSSSAGSSNLLERRKTLLSRNGPYFKIDRANETVEFGATAKLVTRLNNDGDGTSTTANGDSIKEWLSDEKRVAMSIWDEKLITPLGDSVYELKLMKLQFVTIQLQPTVDMRMWGSSKQDVFYLQSVDFEPNIQVLPGLGINAKDLGIDIEVVGQLAPTGDGKGVAGRIAFQTSGKLPPPFLLLPEAAIKAASDAINKTITQFAIQSFEKGVISKYNEFLKSNK